MISKHALEFWRENLKQQIEPIVEKVYKENKWIFDILYENEILKTRINLYEKCIAYRLFRSNRKS